MIFLCLFVIDKESVIDKERKRESAVVTERRLVVMWRRRLGLYHVRKDHCFAIHEA